MSTSYHFHNLRFLVAMSISIVSTMYFLRVTGGMSIDFLYRVVLLTMTLMNQGRILVKLKASRRKL
jgi:hypothetical protein